jgi:hypothetical protein
MEVGHFYFGVSIPGWSRVTSALTVTRPSNRWHIPSWLVITFLAGLHYLRDGLSLIRYGETRGRSGRTDEGKGE